MTLKFNKVAVHAKETNEQKYIYAKAAISGKMGTEELATRLSKTTQWSKGAIIGFLHDLATFLVDECGDGTQITLDGIGVFEPAVKGKSAEKAEDIKKTDLTPTIILKANSDLLQQFAHNTQLEYSGNLKSEVEGEQSEESQAKPSTPPSEDGDMKLE